MSGREITSTYILFSGEEAATKLRNLKPPKAYIYIQKGNDGDES